MILEAQLQQFCIDSYTTHKTPVYIEHLPIYNTVLDKQEKTWS